MRVGLSKKNQPTHSLLSQVGGRPTVQRYEPPGLSQPPLPLKMERGTKVKEYDPITAPPESSDDEEAARSPVRPFKAPLSSDDDEPPRGDIKPTIFGKGNRPPASQVSNPRKSTRNATRSLEGDNLAASGSQAEGPSSSAGSKRQLDEHGSQAGSHLVDEYGFVQPKKRDSKKMRVPGKANAKNQGYGKPRSYQKSAPRSFTRQRDATPPRRGFKDYDPSSPEQATSHSKFGLKVPSPSGSSPHDTPRKHKLRPHSVTPDDSPRKGGIKLFDSDGPELGTGVTSPNDKQTSRSRTSRRSQNHTKKSYSPDNEPTTFSQKPAFKLPSDIDDLNGSVHHDGGVSTDLIRSLHDGNDEDIDILATQAPKEARCPMCHELVDPELLEKHSDRGRMNIRKQTAFCRMHKRRTALNSGTARGYPEIDWSTMESRLARHESFLQEILEGSRPSHYVSLLKEKIETGKNRTLLKTDDSVTPGYYGPKGLRVMTDFIMRRLSSVIRKRAVEDRLISARSYTGYVQAVLVPELAVRLVVEDMSVSDKEARDILRDSIEVGELLHEETGDVIAHVSEDEDI